MATGNHRLTVGSALTGNVDVAREGGGRQGAVSGMTVKHDGSLNSDRLKFTNINYFSPLKIYRMRGF